MLPGRGAGPRRERQGEQRRTESHRIVFRRHNILSAHQIRPCFAPENRRNRLKPIVHLTPEEFETLVGEGLNAIPEKFRAKLSNVAMVVEDEPTAEQRRKLRLRRDHDLFGLYEGIPQTSRGNHYSWVLPDKITIFRNAILAHARDAAEVKRMVCD